MRVAGILIAWIALTASGVAVAAEPALPPDVEGICRFLGTPVRPERGRQAWDLTREREALVAERLAAALGSCGGLGAIEPLLELMRDRDSGVRIAAMRGVGRVSLRDEKALKRLREVVRWRQGDERQAAMLALGSIGDARDVDILLGLGLDPDDPTALTAFRALAHLTGVRLPPVHARWSYWWRSTRPRLVTDLVADLAAIEDEPDGVAADVHREKVARSAWVDIQGVRARLDLWLRASDDDLRRHAVRLVGETGMCHLAPRVERLRLFSRQGESLHLAIDEVLLTMGLTFPPEPVQVPPAGDEEPAAGDPADDDSPQDAPADERPAEGTPADDAAPQDAPADDGPAEDGSGDKPDDPPGEDDAPNGADDPKHDEVPPSGGDAPEAPPSR